MCAAQHEGPVEEEDPVRPQEAPRTGKEPECCLPRRDVTIFKEIIVSNGASSSTPHTPPRTSMATGARTLASPSVALHALMLAREAESGSLGSQTSPGSAFAKEMTCSPVPDPISSAMPFFGRTRVSTSRIGPRLRAADGENCRASPTRLRTSTESGPSLGIVGTGGPEEYF